MIIRNFKCLYYIGSSIVGNQYKITNTLYCVHYVVFILIGKTSIKD